MDDGEVAAGLLGRAVAGVDEDDDGVGGRRAGDHVPGVLDVSGAVGEDERAAVGGEVPVGDVDRDALFAFGPEAVGEEGEVELAADEAAFGARRGHGRKLVGEDRLRIVEEASDEVDLPSSTEPAVANRSSVFVVVGATVVIRSIRPSSGPPWRRRRSCRRARVAPRSVTVVTATSATTEAMSAAVDSTAPVQLMSPTVR